MNQQRLFRRKVMYFSAIAVLLFPLFELSQPATTKSPGGQLAQLRHEYQLSQADLGMIDPTSVSMKLATFGLQGAAANVLWSRATEYKEREEFADFDATLQQITYLQPHFYKVWDFQGHNVAFNISVEFDDYRDRYDHVIKGFNLLKKGIRYNDKEARLLRRLAFYTGIKIGRSDERRFFRPMFAKDMEYHAPESDQNWLLSTRYEGRPEDITDNWLVSKWWYEQAEQLLDGGVIEYGTMNPFLIHSEPPMQQMQYAEALENDGFFGDAAMEEWKQASDEWLAYGLRPILAHAGFLVKLEDMPKLLELRNKARAELDELEPGVRDRLVAERIEKLPTEQRAAIEVPAAERTAAESELAWRARQQLKIPPTEIAAATNEENREAALKLAERFYYYESRFRIAEKYRKETINYDYWKNRAETEQTKAMIAARKTIHQAKEAFRATDIPTARAAFEHGLDLWRAILDEHPKLLQDETFVMDLMEMIEGYTDVLAQVRESGSRELPDDFVLPDVLERQSYYQRRGAVMEVAE